MVAATTALAATPAQQGKRVAKGLAGKGLTRAQVDAAIEKGKRWLVERVGQAEEVPNGLGLDEPDPAVALAPGRGVGKNRRRPPSKAG